MTGRILRLALALMLLAALPAAAETIDGRWELTEQFYGEGTNNLADPGAAVRIEFERRGGELAAAIWSTAGGGRHAWPAFVADDGPRPLERVEVVSRPDQVQATYRVRPSADESADDPLQLEIVERYTLHEDGSLRGTMTVRFLNDDEDRGSFVLHRRFERLP